MPTLSEQLTAWRTSNQGGTGHSGLMTQLTIDGVLYDIKDPAVDYLAGQIESRLSTVENKTIRQTALDDSAVTGQFITSVSQGTDGQISITRDGVSATNVAFDPTSTDFDSASTTVQAALVDALTQALALKGTSSDTASDETIAGAKAFATDLVNNLAGTNWTANAKKVQEIIEELENSDNANAWATAIDKLAGLDIKYTQAEANTHNAGLTGAISTETALTAEQAAALNEVLGTETYTVDMTPSEADANTYNATLEGAWSTSTVKTPQTVKQYVDAKIAEVEAVATGGLSELDTVESDNITTTNNVDAVSEGHNVGVKITQENGLITDVTVLEDDIASAADLAALTSTVETHSEVTAAALVDLDTRLTTLNTSVGAIDLTVKANKAAITTASINNWSSSYSNGNLQWTNTPTTVYVPVTGQSL